MWLLVSATIIGGTTGGAILGLYYEQVAKQQKDVLIISDIIKDGSPTLGDLDAPITMVEWGDYQCTFCYRFHQTTLQQIMTSHVDTNKVKIIFKDFPLNGQDSVLAAEATHCAHEQEAYWEYHDTLYHNWGGERTGWITLEALVMFAHMTNLNLEEFGRCMDEDTYTDNVNNVYKSSKMIGIDATPSFMIFNDKNIIKIVGNQPLESFLRAFTQLENS